MHLPFIDDHRVYALARAQRWLLQLHRGGCDCVESMARLCYTSRVAGLSASDTLPWRSRP